MKKSIQISPELSVGSQPDEEDLKQIATVGTKSIVNLRTEDEEDQDLSPSEEGFALAKLGMTYRHIPVPPDDLSPALVDRFRAELAELPTPTLVHCASGKRAGAFVMMHLAVENGWSADEALERAKETGFECDQPELKEFFKSYVNSHC